MRQLHFCSAKMRIVAEDPLGESNTAQKWSSTLDCNHEHTHNTHKTPELRKQTLDRQGEPDRYPIPNIAVAGRSCKGNSSGSSQFFFPATTTWIWGTPQCNLDNLCFWMRPNLSTNSFLATNRLSHYASRAGLKSFIALPRWNANMSSYLACRRCWVHLCLSAVAQVAPKFCHRSPPMIVRSST